MARAQIINPANILNRQQVLNEDWIFKDLLQQIPTKEAAIQFCAQRSLLSNTSQCQPCNRARSLCREPKIDGVIWRCPRCQSRKSIRAESFFDNSKLSLQQILLFAYGWSRDWMLKDCNLESGGMGPKTQTDWGNFLRDICQDDIRRNGSRVGGFHYDANGVLVQEVVEIDETLVASAKYHRGRQIDQRWVFGGIERGSRACFLVEVPDRTAATLEPLIEEYILPGTRIISDGWASYTNIDQIAHGIYTHDVIIHEHHYVDPQNPDIHTNNVENN